MSVPLLHLQDQLSELTIAPSLGASLVNWRLKASGQALLRPTDAAALASGNPRQLGCYPLAPWSNRIAHGGFECPGGWLALQANSAHDPYPIHGSAWQQAWQVQQCSVDRARLCLVSTLPFAYQATLDVQLHGGCLSLALQVIHQGPMPTWYGLGLHPYFPRLPDTRLQVGADSVWLADDDGLPTRQAALPEPWNFGDGAALPGTLVDHAFSGWAGDCVIEQPTAGYRLRCRASGAEHFMLYCPPQQAFFCFEPVSHPVNAHHLPQRPGLRLLETGQATGLSWHMQYQAL
ncbi:aldose 1-epimerase [Pseudomonas sp. SMSB3]|uniref:aldose 1-epimerase n=1 Tax=Pseudomonas sp. SMSB3 TaxID=3390196 RepID=UPI003F87297D